MPQAVDSLVFTVTPLPAPQPQQPPAAGQGGSQGESNQVRAEEGGRAAGH